MEDITSNTDISNDTNDITSPPKNIESYIENQIEKKINSLLESLPEKLPDEKLKKDTYNITIYELYKNTLQTTIDIINDITILDNINNIDTNVYINKLINILTTEDRKLYVGIILIILSFVLYFIDGASV